MLAANHDLVRTIAGQFAVAGELLGIEPFGRGHIHDSYCLTCLAGMLTRSTAKACHPPAKACHPPAKACHPPAKACHPPCLPTPPGQASASSDPAHRDPPIRRYLLQRLNTAIFKQPSQVMENIARVTAHIAERRRGLRPLDPRKHPGERVLRLVPARDGAPFLRDTTGGWWRMYDFLEDTYVRETIEDPDQAETAARAYAEFQRALLDLPGPRLHETIPDFHNTPRRYATLQHAITADVAGRAGQVRPEIEFLMDRRRLAGVLVDLQQAGEIPERVVHNDAKLSNVLLDALTGAALCVVDLDTVMPGLSLYDFGDMVRSMTCPAAEDEPDLHRVAVQVPLFGALARGYLAVAREFLTTAEITHLITAGKIITLEQGVRFLTDYLNGDTYYKAQRPAQNLDRARTQLKLVASLERLEPVLGEIIATV